LVLFCDNSDADVVVTLLLELLLSGLLFLFDIIRYVF
jgi:hypothetical protein